MQDENEKVEACLLRRLCSITGSLTPELGEE